MPENLTLILILLLIVGGIVAVIAYNIARFMRGTIKLTLPRTAFHADDEISGTIDLHVKKPIESNRLTVSLVGLQVTKIREDGKTRTRSHEIYRDDVMVEGAKAYSPGHKSQYAFTIAVPDLGKSDFAASALGQTLTAAVQILSDKHTYLKWRLESRLDAKGIDLTKSMPVSINIKQ